MDLAPIIRTRRRPAYTPRRLTPSLAAQRRAAVSEVIYEAVPVPIPTVVSTAGMNIPVSAAELRAAAKRGVAEADIAKLVAERKAREIKEALAKVDVKERAVVAKKAELGRARAEFEKFRMTNPARARIAIQKYNRLAGETNVLVGEHGRLVATWEKTSKGVWRPAGAAVEVPRKLAEVARISPAVAVREFPKMVRVERVPPAVAVRRRIEREVELPPPPVFREPPELRRLAIPEEAGYVLRWDVKGVPYYSPERIEAAVAKEAELTVKGLALFAPLAGPAVLGGARAAAELGFIYGAEEVTAPYYVPALKRVFPRRPPETYETAAQWLGIATGVAALGVGRVAAKAMIRKPLTEKGFIELFKRKKKPLLPKKIQLIEAERYLAPRKPLQYEELMLERALKPPKFKIKFKPRPPAKFKPTIVKPKEIPTFPELAARRKMVELGKFLEPAKPLTYKELALEKALKPVKPLPKAVKFKPERVWRISVAEVKKVPKFPELAAKGRLVELGKYLEPKRPLLYEEKVLQKLLRGWEKQVVPTTAALRKARQLPFKEFVAKVKRIEKPLKLEFAPPTFVPAAPAPAIPEAYRELAKALARYAPVERPIVKPRVRFAEFEAEAMAPRFRLVEVSRLRFGEFLGVTPRLRERAAERARTEERAMARAMERALTIPRIKAVTLEAEAVRAKQLAAVREMELAIPKQLLRFKAPTIAIERFFEPLPKPKPVLRVPPMLLPTLPPFRKPRKPARRLVPGFFPIVRRAGREIALVKFPVSKEAARTIAMANVIGSPRASFKLLAAAAPAVRVAVPRLPKEAALMFVPAKTLPGFYVEKPKYRIKEAGELLGITQKGLEKLRMYPWLRKPKKKRRRRKK